MASYLSPYVPQNLCLIFNLTGIQGSKSLNGEYYGAQVKSMKELQVENVYPTTHVQF